MKKIKLNPTWSASVLDGVVYVHWRGFSGDIREAGRPMTKEIVRRLLRLKRPTTVDLPSPRGTWPYDFARKPRYIQIGCQKFYLTRVKKLLSLFP